MTLRRCLLVGLAAMAVAGVPLTGASADDTGASRGYDVSHPQCSQPLPADAAFVVLGVNAGRVFSANPCLSAQTGEALERGLAPSYYANTANPGPLLSRHWPSGQLYPKICATDYPANDSADCSYDYGWNAAEDAYRSAYSAAQEAVGGGAAEPRAGWWLDVETANTWQSLEYGATAASRERDIAALAGAVDYLSLVGVAQVGFYSSPSQWSEITGGTGNRFAEHPVWLAGAGDLGSARARCLPSYSFTGGAVLLAQYLHDGYDANLRCAAG